MLAAAARRKSGGAERNEGDDAHGAPSDKFKDSRVHGTSDARKTRPQQSSDPLRSCNAFETKKTMSATAYHLCAVAAR
jgi:hypothetical protein